MLGERIIFQKLARWYRVLVHYKPVEEFCLYLMRVILLKSACWEKFLTREPITGSGLFRKHRYTFHAFSWTLIGSRLGYPKTLLVIVRLTTGSHLLLLKNGTLLSR